ncbi:MAG: DNA polymerase III subunit delta' [Candidatus Omnitrophota bacterium]|jgi:DNA polymerase-3 subunit delta'
MVLLNDIQGQNNAIKYLSRSLSAGRRANSYLFYGPEGVGRVLTAKAFLMSVMCRESGAPDKACGGCPSCAKVSEFRHPDIVWIKPGKNRKIKIEEIRKARDVLNLKPFEAPANACVIEDAHMMTVEASNSLLKILEEPPERSLLILISSKKELLLPTIVSRCTEVRFNPLPLETARTIISRTAAISEKDADFLAHFTEGSPGQALEVIEGGVLERRKDIARMLEKAAGEKNASCLVWDKEDKDCLLEDIELLMMFFRDVVLDENSEVYQSYKEYPVAEISKIVEQLAGLKQALLGNVNPKLVAQALPGRLRR